MNPNPNIQTQLLQLKQKLYDLSARNPLVNIKANKLWHIDDVGSKTIEAVYKKQNYFKKEYGLDTVLNVSHFIRWKSPKKDKYYTSPLLYKTARVVKNQKISLQFEVKIQNENIQINPVLIDSFKSLFNIKLSIEQLGVEVFLENLVGSLQQHGDSIIKQTIFNNAEEWQIITANTVGNFNYKKSALAHDYNQILIEPNSSINHILGEAEFEEVKIDLNLQLPLSDASQQKAIEHAFCKNTVIQGPPGTGKSHTIVELIKQNLLHSKKVLFVSEKKSALDVVYGKLKQEKLSHLTAYFNAEKNQKKEFYKHLKHSVEYIPISVETQKQNKNQYNDLINYFNDYSCNLTQKHPNSSSIHNIVTYLAEHQITDFEFDITSQIPSYKTWLNYREFLLDIETIAAQKFSCKTISDLTFTKFNKSAFVGNSPLQKIQIRLNELQEWQTKIDLTLKKYNFNWTWSELNKYSLAASVLQMSNKSQLAILDPNDKAFKSFNTWTKKYELTHNKLKLVNDLCAKWKTKPQLADIDALINQISQIKTKKWFQFFKTSQVETVFKNYPTQLSNELKIKVLYDLKNEYELTNELEELKLKLKHNLNILNPDIDIDNILNMRQKLDSLSPNQYVFILEHLQSVQLIKDLHQLHPHIQQTNQIVKFLFVDFKIDNLQVFNKEIKAIKCQSARFTHYLPEIKKTVNLPYELLNFVKRNKLTVNELTHCVMYHNYLELVKFKPNLKQLDSIDILSNYRLLKSFKQTQNTINKNAISKMWFSFNKNKEELLLTPASKLSTEQKEHKKVYKTSKRIVYHEIAKQQQHLPIKQLVEQTQYSIFETLPLWIMNPLTIAENLPCDSDLFDVVIFDESSQIPIEDALPAIYRAKQVVVVGDSKQMPPSQFFSGSTESTTLLNQADSVFKSQLLTWHYRSQHPKLMQFSNHNFYDNELCYFPSVSDKSPIDLIYLENAIFENSVNNIEAKAVANQYQSLLKLGVKNCAIIAFSKTQESQIKIEINKLSLPLNEELLIRNLENAQGIERDVVIVSIGYAHNSEGVFRLNFGPINQDYGANRLNVLLTRAKQKLIICTSVKSTDFKLSDNRGVQLVKEFLSFSEQYSSVVDNVTDSFILGLVKSELDSIPDVIFYKAINGLAVNCFVQHSTQKILLIDPSLHQNDNKDIYTLLSVLNDRFKSVKIVLTHDYWHNKSRFQKEILDWFTV